MMEYLDVLNRHAIRASIRKGGVLWLDPVHLITDEIAQTVRTHREGIIAEIMACADPHENDILEIIPGRKIIWVATDLNWFDGTDPRIGYETLEHPYIDPKPGICYRQLDPTYYAWLDHMVSKALKAYDSRRLGKDAYHQMRWNLNPVEELAYELFGEEACGRAKRTFSAGHYARPTEETYAAYRRAVDQAYAEHLRRRKAPSPPISG